MGRLSFLFLFVGWDSGRRVLSGWCQWYNLCIQFSQYRKLMLNGCLESFGPVYFSA